jgi:hypothetical protein
VSGIRWSDAQELRVHAIGELQDRTGTPCDDDEVLHTEAGNVALVITDDSIGEQYVLEGSPGQLEFLVDLLRTQLRAVTRD